MRSGCFNRAVTREMAALLESVDVQLRACIYSRTLHCFIVNVDVISRIFILFYHPTVP